ncbi:MAG: hypothetical protein ACP5N7_06500 [Candidatus Pacearchaeota archaeon]
MDDKQLAEWLKKNSATIIFTPAGILATADIKVGKFTTTISGMHKNDASLAAHQLAEKAQKSIRQIRNNSEQLEKQVQEMQSENSFELTEVDMVGHDNY